VITPEIPEPEFGDIVEDPDSLPPHPS